MNFIKMHGIGNDYIYVDEFVEPISSPEIRARILSDRNFAIGADGLILLKPSRIADVCMEMYNADGSYGLMCGNGARCIAKLAYDRGYVKDKKFTVESGGMIKKAEIISLDEYGKAKMIKINMGEPELFSDIDENINICGKAYKFVGVDIGNPHAVYECLSIDEVNNLELNKIGPYFENHERFKDRVNSEFIYIEDENNIHMRVWERGSGETMACGTGAVAVAFASFIRHKELFVATEGVRKTCVHLRGGDLHISYDENNNECFMTGEASYSFFGETSAELEDKINDIIKG